MELFLRCLFRIQNYIYGAGWFLLIVSVVLLVLKDKASVNLFYWHLSAVVLLNAVAMFYLLVRFKHMAFDTPNIRATFMPYLIGLVVTCVLLLMYWVSYHFGGRYAP